MSLKVVIMAGGKGERLWPVSSPQTPKQLLPLHGTKSLLRTTFERALGLAQPEDIYVVTGRGLIQKVQEELPEIPPGNILAEPVGKNTAPCIGFAAVVISRKDPDATMAVFPSDHLIREPERLKEAILFGVSALASHPDLLITLGVVPDRPETGYGYIAPETVLLSRGGLTIKRVRAFHEKPARIVAEQYVKDGYLWNAGMFLWRVDTILEMFSRHMPELHEQLQELKATMDSDASAVDRFFNEAQSVSIDYGIMEKAGRVAVIPVDIGWSDVGTWDAMGNLYVTDDRGNSVRGPAELINSENNVIWSTDKRIVLIGVSDLVVVEGSDSILVCPRALSQEVSVVAKKLGDGK
ncbi:MAG TPA: mannose-1-phosphate guanylyltransferase [Deltaproteobacteria bacterium]|nr:mannose-1-phosphate guanylyltransferase [Deltaproteobacteria bacterium]HPP81662.1 mannose-1-phosphate guanylyltransferase [Deltaproteobacteria bacterium]